MAYLRHIRFHVAAVIIVILVRCVDAQQNATLPVIVEHPLDTIVARGEPVTLNCKAEGDASIEWFKDGAKVTTNVDQSDSHRVLLHGGSLFFLSVEHGKNAKTQDAGTYHCVATNEEGLSTSSRDAVLRIAMLRDEFRTRPRNVQAVVGQQAIMECAAPRGFPEPVVAWKKDNKELRAEDDARVTVHSSGNLIITDVRQSDTAFYSCVASNMVGQKESNSARLSVYEKPDFVHRPEDITSEVGKEVLFTCRVSGDPSPVIVWRKRNGKMPLGRAQILESKGLRIERVVPTDEGEYVCQAKNPAGAIEASARLIVHAPPTFSRQPSDAQTDEGATASFECAAVGNPLPAKFWTKEGSQQLMFPGHTSKDGRVTVANDGTLTIANVHATDNGYYVCSALNAAGSNIAKGYLKVAGRAMLQQPPPLIAHGPANQTLSTGSLAILPCKAVGHSKPHITWLKDMKALEPSERYNQLTSGALQVNGLVEGDSGIYTCQAKNGDGETTWSASLTVAAPTDPNAKFHRMPEPSMLPSAPGKPDAVNVTDTTITLEWSKSAKSGDSAVSGYLLQYFSPQRGQTWYNVADVTSTTQTVVTGLNAASSYVFVVRAENDAGIGQPSYISAIVHTKGDDGHLVGQGENFDLQLARTRLGGKQLVKLLDVKTVNSTAVKLFWKQIRNEPLIAGYYVKWRGEEASAQATVTRWVNVTQADVNHATVILLQPYTQYTFFVVPYFKSVEGVPSNTMHATTSEAPPSASPRDVRVRMMNMTTLRVSWRPPPPSELNGQLAGYNILVLGNSSRHTRNISTSERAASVTLFHLIPQATYRVRVAAKTNAGIGVYHGEDVVAMTANTLRAHNEIARNAGGRGGIVALLTNPYVIGCVGAVVWLALVILILWLWYKRWRRGKKDALSPFIKINDGSVMAARDALWIDPATQFNTAQRNLLINGHITGGGTTSGYGSQPDMQYHQQMVMLSEGGPPPYNQHLASTLSRSHPHQYAHLCSNTNVSTFWQNGGPAMPQQQQELMGSPYATTNLVMQAHARNLALQQQQHGQQQQPHNGFMQHQGYNTVGRQASASQGSSSGDTHSPPHTDTSYVPHMMNTSQRRSARPALADFLPPPPQEAPPPAPTAECLARSAPLHRRTRGQPMQLVNGGDGGDYDYETLNDYLMRNFHSSSPLQAQQQQQQQPQHRQTGRADEYSIEECCSSASDVSHTEDDPCLSGRHNNSSGVPRRQPCMGVSASALTQSTHVDNAAPPSTANQRTPSSNGSSSSRLRSLSRQKRTAVPTARNHNEFV